MANRKSTRNPLLAAGNTVKVLVIDPIRLEIVNREWNSTDFDTLYRWIGANTLDHVIGPPLKDGVRGCIFIDDWGAHKPLPKWRWPAFYPNPISGIAVMFGADRTGELTLDVPYTIDHALRNIHWQILIPLKDGPGVGHG